MGNVAESIRDCIDLPLEYGVLFLAFCFKGFFIIAVEVLSEPFLGSFADRDFKFCAGTIKKGCFFLYRVLYSIDQNGLGESLKKICQESSGFQEVWSKCIMLQADCSKESSVAVMVAHLLLYLYLIFFSRWVFFSKL